MKLLNRIHVHIVSLSTLHYTIYTNIILLNINSTEATQKVAQEGVDLIQILLKQDKPC